ncbi:MAG: ADP-ribosylglycohydrolase family protein [Clostridia bacterium]|nr:ADP-ribosylglycohydrolase family protein [Clostridia bacterium]
MAIKDSIYKLRSEAHLSQAKFAAICSVSSQSVQKWESGASEPTLDKLILIARRFGVSLDALVLDRGGRSIETIIAGGKLRPHYEHLHNWELYSASLREEFRQCTDEGLDVSAYADVFEAVSRMPVGEAREDMADVLFRLVQGAPVRPDFPYEEPSTLDGIRRLSHPVTLTGSRPDDETFFRKVYGAWVGRVAGCVAGKSVEGMRTNELVPFLKMTNNYPMHRYIRRADFTDEDVAGFSYDLTITPYPDRFDGVTPPDDDTNYTVMASELIERYGRDFTPADVAHLWLDSQKKDAYCTAERVAFCNFVRGYEPPASAIYKNPFREWIGAQIRADYFGYINPGNPSLAAEMAFRDASISHVKNGIYGEMFVAAMLAAAAVSDDMHEIIAAGLGEIPATSRLHKAVSGIVSLYDGGAPREEAFRRIHTMYDEYTNDGWCHTIPNAMIVVACLLYGGENFGRSIGMAVETGFDTDCNGATVGSILGMKNTIAVIGEEWRAPLCDTLRTDIHGVPVVSLTEMARRTLRHAK